MTELILRSRLAKHGFPNFIVTGILISVIFCALLVLSIGYKSAPIALIVPLLIYCFLSRTVPLAALPPFLLLICAAFDNPAFTWHNGLVRVIRIQWFVAAIVTATFCLKTLTAVSSMGTRLWVLLSIALIMTLFHLPASDINGLAYSIKYWVFYWIPAISIFLYAKKFGAYRFNDAFLIWLICVLSVWGLLQYYLNVSQFPEWVRSSFQLDWYNSSPTAFFSERTWYGEVAACGLPLLLCAKEENSINNKQCLILLLILLFAVLISFSRNAIIGAALWIILSICFSSKRIKLALYLFAASLIGASALAIIKAVAPQLTGHLLGVIDRFTLTDGSGIGRLEAIDMSIRQHLNASWLELFSGHGFNWSETESSATGTAIGSKSANVFDFIASIFGFPFLTILLTLSLVGGLALTRHHHLPKERAVLILALMWLTMAQFAPMHQEGFTLFLLVFSLGSVRPGKLRFMRC